MKIAMIVSTFYPKIGGMGRIVLAEAEGFAKQGDDVTVFTMAYPGQSLNEDLEKIKIRRIKPYFRLGDGGWLSDFSDELNKFDIVHLHYPFYGGAHVILKIKKTAGAKIIITCHMEATPKGILKNIFKFFYDSLYNNRIWRQADKIILVDRGYFQNLFLSNKVPQEKIISLNNCVDTEQFFYSPKRFASNKINLLFVGNLLPIKGLDVLFKLIKKNPGKYILTVVGGGYAEADYRKLVEDQNISDDVVFAGAVTDPKQMMNFYHRADALIIPSYKESFSLAAAEAMSAGCPIVVSDIPGLRERVKDGQDGFLFPMGDMEGLNKAIDKLFLMNTEQKKSFLLAARKKIEQVCSLQKHLADLMQIYGG